MSNGWTEQTASTDLETADELIDNPISAFDYWKAHITNYLFIKTREQFQKEKTIEGETEFNSLIV